MTNLNLQTEQIITFGILYIAYLCWVMFGGMRKKKIKLSMYVIMTVLLLWGLMKEYNGIHSYAEVINICGILLIGMIKGIYLGKKKIVEKINEDWYLHHDYNYIIAWVIFFVVKLLFTQILKIATGEQIPLWHMILYFDFYYPWRTVNIFLANAQMRREVLAKRECNLFCVNPLDQ